ncbi:signal transduction histidine kinase/CheY-like chemotaxis protein [Pseudomonas citronellolis]|uniref:hybrid sensor histidine kinase/response regulator n=1 Tax=Pseudomonas citronellolis TaxID=53408 RepID=UPI00209D7D15|nr:hybrid sensor histidine kinase/response regulator [Pseudomonas citronellolis]MCP1642956.1 signal transduction histidine kinase/CheY-like chemotaxis protein [Pseudomonas citronellolis]MCP1665912.1 signal transduction histidine kinase/CheY-like chemotaxis protein [Pseudomonas citronellolis]MCP1696821.1 signal transduction histidine kinase/CheY-like chemotaxis protein [Pseudomonas citronellolis]MCP1703437.1 signal transduction histidine kinase/CheY-like chemotaxis protein [Pseudomonas citronell
MQRWLILFLLLLSPLAGAVSFDEHTSRLPLGHSIDVFEDVRGTADIADITSAALADSFRRHDRDVLNAGYSRSVFWIRLDLDYRPQESQDPAPWLLELAYPPLDRLDLYLPDADGKYRLAQRTGDTLPFASRPISLTNYLFDLKLAPGKPLRVYLRLESQGSIQAPLTLWSPKAYMENLPGNVYVLGIIYGVLLVMLVYNLFIFVSVRDTSYLYYILYIASFGLYQVSVNGAGIEYFWPDSPWWANAATPFLIGSAGLFGCQFARSFLHTREHSPWVDRTLLALMAVGALVMLLALSASYALSLRLATYLALAFVVVIFSAGILAWLRGMRVARYFIFAWTAFLLGGTINTLMVLGFLPNVFFTMYSGQIGSALEVGLLSLALADRINAMKEERTRILQESSRKLEQLNLELANSNRLKDEFLATVTHELRTPMSGVIGSLELMQTVPMDVELAQYQKTATGSARDMMRMVNDILALIELQAGKLYPRREPFSLRGLFDSLRAQYAPRAEAKGLRFDLQLDENLPDTLEGDAGKLAQTLGYLLDNAIKFTHQGGVSLRVDGQRQSDGVALQVTVQDSGIGFETPADDALYQRFHQLDGSLTREYGGLGIGLALCRQLTELLGGQLQHHSSPGRGSRFVLELNLGQPAQSFSVPPRRAGGQALRRPEQCMVLVVEDNAINQLVIRGMLLKLGYRVRTADNGSEAIDLLRREGVDAVLLDCQMPIMDGFATCRAIRTLPQGGELPVLAITAHSHSGDRERCLAAGMSDYLAKPVKFEELQTLLHDWLLCQPALPSHA